VPQQPERGPFGPRFIYRERLNLGEFTAVRAGCCRGEVAERSSHASKLGEVRAVASRPHTLRVA